MAESSAIEWTDATWSPIYGCTKVDAACGHCYIPRTPPYRIQGLKFEKGHIPIRLMPERLDVPLRWRRPRMIFVNSLSDTFHEDVPTEFIERMFVTMALAPRHTFQVLTKRIERAAELLSDFGFRNFVVNTAAAENVRVLRKRGWEGQLPGEHLPRWPLPNVWVGTTIGNARFSWRADVLREVPAAVRFISAEPLLGSLFERAREGGVEGACGESAAQASAENGKAGQEVGLAALARSKRPLDLTGIDWVICGGESGGRFARPMHPAWARELRDACLAPGAWWSSEDGPRPAFFFKQWGSWQRVEVFAKGDERVVAMGSDGLLCSDYCEALRSGATFMRYMGASPKSGGRELDGREWNEMPESR